MTLFTTDRAPLLECPLQHVGPCRADGEAAPLPSPQRDFLHTRGREAIMDNYTYSLSLLHRRFDDAIRRELKMRAPDWIKVLRMKKLRLAVKDRLNTRLAAMAG